MRHIAADIEHILQSLAEHQQPAAPAFQPTGHRNIWLGTTPDGVPRILKRSASATEGLVYRSLASRYSLPAPALHHVAVDLGGQGCWLVLEPVECAPYGLPPSAATHWWQVASRRERAMVALARIHASCWNRPAELAEHQWLRRYTGADYERALHNLRQRPAGWCPLSEKLLGQLASGAEMLLAGPETLIHGRPTVDNIGWRGELPVLLDWEQCAWATPYVDVGRMLFDHQSDSGRAELVTPLRWRADLLDAYRVALLAAGGIELDPTVLARGARHGGLWELAVDLWLYTRQPEPANAARWESLAALAEAVADDPWLP